MVNTSFLFLIMECFDKPYERSCIKESCVLQLSWTFEKEGTKLEWRWKCRPSPDCKSATAGVLDFLMDANIRLSVRVKILDTAFDFFVTFELSSQDCVFPAVSIVVDVI